MKEPVQTIRVYPSGPLKGSVLPPTSKYHTLRCILAAFLAKGGSRVFYPAVNDDTDVLLRICTHLGATISIQQQDDRRCIISITGIGEHLRVPEGTILDVGNAGAVLRLLLGICALSPEKITFVTSYPKSLGKRPNSDLLQALTQMGVIVESATNEGNLPIKIRGGHEIVRGGKVQISGKKCSQYISALLFVAPLLNEGLEIEIVDGVTSVSFIDLTLDVLKEAGIEVLVKERYRHYVIPGMQNYQNKEYVIPGDYPSAAALLAAVAITKGEITLANLQAGDTDGEAVLNVFAEMGMDISQVGNSLKARSMQPLRGITFDGNKTIDSVPAIVAATCFANSPSHIYNIENLHLKESDRIHDLATELNKIGCSVIPLADAIKVHPLVDQGINGGVSVDGHADHRLIEAFVAVGLGSREPVTIAHAQHVAKSYPYFFRDLAHLGAKIENVE